MKTFRKKLESGLEQIPHIKVDNWKDTNLICVFYNGKEIAHFHDDQEIDIRMSQKFIRNENIRAVVESKYHPNRSKKSRWVIMQFKTDEDVDKILKIIGSLVRAEYDEDLN